MTATVAVPQAHTFMQVTMEVVGSGSGPSVPQARKVLDVSGEVIPKPSSNEAQPASRRADADFRPPAVAIVARYLASVEPREDHACRSVYA